MDIKIRQILIFKIILIATLPYGMASNLVQYTDDWDYSYSTTTDGSVWGGYSLDTYAYGYNSEADCLCWDWCDDGSDDDDVYSDWDACWCKSTTKKNDCKSYSTWITNLDNDGKIGINSNLGSTHSIDTGSSGDRWKCGVDLREYRDCDNSASQRGIYNHEDQDGRAYYIVYPKKHNCDGEAYDTQGKFETSTWVIWDQDRSCGTYKRCDTNSAHNSYDDQEITSATSNIPNPCSTRDGTTINYACNGDDDCYSGNCGGVDINNRFRCPNDGQITAYKQQQEYHDTCGGQGYLSADWADLYTYSCTDANIGGSGYVCDEAHDLVELSSEWSPSPCRKNLDQSCSQTTDCWNDDGGNWCSSISKCTNGANGRNCGIDSDCNSGRCDSTCMSKIGDGQACDENSDCTNGNCISGYCGGPLGDTCNGTLEINSLDGNAQPISTIVEINSQSYGATDSNGQLFTSVTNVECSSDQTLTVTCSDNVTQCYSSTFQVDFNGDYEVYTLNCNMCKSNEDIYISNEDIKLTKSGSNTKVSANVHWTGLSSGIVTIRFQSIGNDGLISKTEDKTLSISGTNKSAYVTWDVEDDKYLNVYADPADAFDESNFNNYIFRPIVKKVNAYISIATDTPYLDSTYREFLESFVNPVEETYQADYIISVGKNTDEVASYNNAVLTYSKWGYDTNANRIAFQSSKLDKPYNGLVGTYPTNQKPIIFVHGNGVEGTTAALKRLVSGSEYFFDNANKNPSVIDNFDLTGIGVYDIMHNLDNSPNYRKNNNEFKKIVKDVLFDNIFDVSIRTVKTLNTTSYGNSTILRLKHVNSDFSQNYRDAVTENPSPVVLSGGLFNDLTYWETANSIFESTGLAIELSQEGRDVWEIELTGGSIQDGHNLSPMYNYNDARDYYWPALIAGVQQYSGIDNLTYVGHSNGCGVALASLNKYSASGKGNTGYYFDYDTGLYVYSDLSVNPIDTFVGIGCPGAFNGYSFFEGFFDLFGDSILLKLSNSSHVTGQELGNALAQECTTLSEGSNFWDHCHFTANRLKSIDDFKVSKTLLEDYLNDIQDYNNPPQVDSGLYINHLRLYVNKFNQLYDNPPIFGIPGHLDESDTYQDVVVSTEDSNELASLIYSNTNEEVVTLDNFWHGRTGHSGFERDVRRFLNGEE